jgi:5-methylcytosine-specific restriction endonuclease McrA
MSSGVLVLNATFEPINVVHLHRAICLVVQEKADVVEFVEGSTFRSADMEIPCPSVVRLRYFVKVPWNRRRPAVSNRNVLGRDNSTCGYCGGTANTVDHIHPVSRGGQNVWMNVIAACTPCNSKKSDLTLEELGWELLFQPTVPADKTWLVIGWTEREQHSRYLFA